MSWVVLMTRHQRERHVLAGIVTSVGGNGGEPVAAVSCHYPRLVFVRIEHAGHVTQLIRSGKLLGALGFIGDKDPVEVPDDEVNRAIKDGPIAPRARVTFSITRRRKPDRP